VILTGYTSINALVKAELFPAHVRALGVGFGYALANSAFGGTAPLIYEAAKKNHAVPEFAWYVTGCIVVSLVVYAVALRPGTRSPLDEPEGVLEPVGR
jgi:MHS family alpha-ketoglutarate permease-like MFS transporter